jgi:hypothetical protein
MLKDFYQQNESILPLGEEEEIIEEDVQDIMDLSLDNISVNDLQYIAEAPMEEDEFCNYLATYITSLEAILIKIEAIKKSERAIKKRLASSIKLYNNLVSTYLYDRNAEVDVDSVVASLAPSTIMKAAEALDDLAYKKLSEKVKTLGEFQH